MNSTYSEQDHLFLKRALKIAAKGGSSVSPNPQVGAVITCGRDIIAEGYHAKYGGPHAEAEALARAGNRAKGATLYCSLEPCSFSSPEKHQGPCTEKIIRAGISRVIIGQPDPNPHVRGRGIKQLQQVGIEVLTTPDIDDFWYANAKFNTRQTLKRPFITIKLAQSLDGRFAAVTNDSKWITDSKARTEVHKLRSEHDVVLTGIGTVRADNPQLNVRLLKNNKDNQHYRQPHAAILDTHARLPLDSHLVQNRAEQLTVYTAEVYSAEEKRAKDFHESRLHCSKFECNRHLERLAALRAEGIRVVSVPLNAMGKLSLLPILQDLMSQGRQSVLVEGGAQIATSFLKEGLFDQLQLYIAPMLIGGDGKSIGSLGIEKIANAVKFEKTAIRTIGTQVVVSGFRKGWLQETLQYIEES